MDKISVVLVTYQRLDYLKLTVAAILSQTYSSIELIVVGDGDQPEVREYINTHTDDRIFYSFVLHAGYPAKARNKGIEISKGKYIAFCDDDDLWHPEKLEKQMLIFLKDPFLDLCCTNRFVIDSAGNIKEGRVLNWIPSKADLRTILITNFVSYSSVLIKADILNKIGLFPDEIKFKAIEDYHLWIRMADKGKLFFLNEKLVYYRVHQSNITKRLSVGAKSVLLIFEDLFPQLRLSYYLKFKAFFAVYAKYTIYKIMSR